MFVSGGLFSIMFLAKVDIKNKKECVREWERERRFTTWGS